MVTQGTGEYSAHTYLYKANSDHSENASQVYAILANTEKVDMLDEFEELDEYMNNVLLKEPSSFDEFLERLDEEISKDAS